MAFQPSEFGIKFNNIIAVPQPMYSESGSGVVEAKILRPRPQPSRPRPRPGPSRSRPRPGPEAKAFNHKARAEMNIHSYI